MGVVWCVNLTAYSVAIAKNSAYSGMIKIMRLGSYQDHPMWKTLIGEAYSVIVRCLTVISAIVCALVLLLASFHLSQHDWAYPVEGMIISFIPAGLFIFAANYLIGLTSPSKSTQRATTRNG